MPSQIQMLHVRNRTFVFYLSDDSLYCAKLQGVPPQLPLHRLGPIYTGEISGFSAVVDATDSLSCLIQKPDGKFIMATSMVGGMDWKLEEE